MLCHIISKNMSVLYIAAKLFIMSCFIAITRTNSFLKNNNKKKLNWFNNCTGRDGCKTSLHFYKYQFIFLFNCKYHALNYTLHY